MHVRPSKVHISLAEFVPFLVLLPVTMLRTRVALGEGEEMVNADDDEGRLVQKEYV